LAVIDVDSGNQPVANEDGNVVAVFNGEIYNYLELRKDLVRAGHQLATAGDSEVLVHLYEESREKLCDRLRGMFAFAIWDKCRSRLVLGRDRFGKKPLYWSKTPRGGLCFASELKALRPLLEASGGKFEFRAEAIYDYLSLGVIPQPETVYQRVKMVCPGSVVVAEKGVVSEWPYWEPQFQPKNRVTYVEAQEETRRRVGEAVRLRLRSDVPLGIFLSSGVDSTVVALEAQRHTAKTVKSFSVAVKDSLINEAPVAARTARALGLDHHELRLDFAPLDEVFRIVDHFDQPFADSSAIASLAVARLAREHVKVALNGDGGDEIFGGYRRYWAVRVAEKIPGGLSRRALGEVLQSVAAKRRRSAPGFLRRFGRGLGRTPGERYLVWTTDLLSEQEKGKIWLDSGMRSTESWIEGRIPSGYSALDEQIAADVSVNLLSDLLVKMDMATMAASLEARSPFLDHEVAEWAICLPSNYRVKHRRLKAVLRDAYKEELPAEVYSAPKRGFEVPLESWLENELSELVADTLGSSQTRLADYVDVNFVRRLANGNETVNGNRPAILYALLMLELWMQQAA
jgi:asparagine synthase (glutamine-hydrolysing)